MERRAVRAMIWLAALMGVVTAADGSERGWLDAQSPIRRVVYLDGTDLKSDLVDFPVEIRFGASDLKPAVADGSDINVLWGEDGRALKFGVEYCDPARGVVLSVVVPRIVAGSARQAVHVYYGGNARAAGSVVAGSDALVLRHDAGRVDGLLISPGADGDFRPVFEAGLVRPALRFDGRGVLQVRVPEDGRKSDKGWTVECIFCDEDADVKGNFHGRSLVSAWPVGAEAGAGQDRGMSGSGFKYDPYAWLPAENRLPLINFGLVNLRVYSCTHLAGRVWENWQMPLFGRSIEPKRWHMLSATYEKQGGLSVTRLYLDGEYLKSDYAGGPLEIGSFCIGSWNRPAWAFKGLIDSVRVSREARSDDWLKARGMSAVGDARFVVFGPVEERGSSAAVSVSTKPVSPVGRLKRYEQPRFRWSVCPGAAKYELTVRLVSAPDKPVVSAVVDGTAYTTDARFEPGEKYAWTVKPVFDAEQTAGETASGEKAAAEVVPFVPVTSSSGEKTASTAVEGTVFEIPGNPVVDMGVLKPPVAQDRMVMRPVDEYRIGKSGPVADRAAGVLKNWVLRYPKVNPDITRCFYEQWRSVPAHAWWGESFGKFMTGAVLFYDITRDESVKAMIDAKIAEAIGGQELDGYLGSYPKEYRLTGPGLHMENWDLYIIHHTLTAFLEYYRITGNETVLRAAMRAADLVCEEFGPGKGNVLDLNYDTASNNYAILGPIVRLYRITGRERYLEFARKIVSEWEDMPGGMEYISLAQKGMHLTDLHWGHSFEMMISWGGMVELYDATGDERLKSTALHWWRDAVAREVAANGNYGSLACEFWCGDPYGIAAMETCAATSLMRYSTRVLMATGDSKCADVIERSLLNAHLGAQLADGSEYMNVAPVNGTREVRPNAHMSCCPAWGLAGLASVRDWAAMVAGKALVINYYGSGTVKSRLGNVAVSIEQRTDYPVGPNVEITVKPSRAAKFDLWLRVPEWSKKTVVCVNGIKLPTPKAGEYMKLAREWKPGDKIELALDFSPRVVRGQGTAAGRVAVYRGPLLMTLDKRFNPGVDLGVPRKLDTDHLRLEPVVMDLKGPKPWVLVRAKTIDGGSVVLCDFASAGVDKSEYAGWF